MGTREHILHCAEELFRKKGYNGVSMRDIAEAAEIKIGNLTYYFPKKELLVEELFASNTAQMYTPEHLDSQEDFMSFFRHILDVQRNTAFYFDSYIQLSQTSEALRRVQCDRLEYLRRLLFGALHSLMERNLILAPGREDELRDKVEIILNVLMLRLPCEERRGAGVEQDDSVLRRLQMIIGFKKE